MTGSKNVLYLSYDGMTDALGQSQVIPYLSGLSRYGFCFTILSFEKKDKYGKESNQIKGILDQAGIRWYPMSYTKSPPVLSALYDYSRLKRKAVLLHKELNFDIIHCRSYIPALAGLALKRKFNIPFVFDMRGFWADERIDGGIWNLKNPVFKVIYQYFKKKEIEFINESDAVVSLTEAGKTEMLNWKNLKIEPGKISVVPCCVDTKLFDPARIDPGKKQHLMQQLGIEPGELIIGYLGSTGTWYLPDEMLAFFSLLKKKINRAKFLFVTHDDAEYITNKAAHHSIDANDIIITKASRKDVPLMISLFDYGIFFIKPAYSKTASSPTKQGEIMAMGIPVICNWGVGDSDQVVERYRAGIAVSPDKVNFENCVQRIASGSRFDANEIRAGALDYFDLDRGINEYFNIYSVIIKQV